MYFSQYKTDSTKRFMAFVFIDIKNLKLCVRFSLHFDFDENDYYLQKRIYSAIRIAFIWF